MADLVRATQIMCDIEFMSVSSYQNGTVSSGRVQIRHDLQQDVTGREIVMWRTLDSGNTAGFLEDLSSGKGRQEHFHRDAAG